MCLKIKLEQVQTFFAILIRYNVDIISFYYSEQNLILKYLLIFFCQFKNINSYLLQYYTEHERLTL